MGVFRKKDENGKPYGPWYIDYYVGGRRKRETYMNKTEAKAALSARLTDIKRGDLRLESFKKVLFEKFAKKYLDYKKANKRRSWERDEISLDHLKKHFKGIPLSKITVAQIEAYKKARHGKVKDPTINRELACLRNLFTIAKKLGDFNGKNPVMEVDFFKEPKREEYILNKDEIDRLIEVAANHLKPIIILALNTGLRRSEILSLKWADIDFEKNEIFVKKTKSGKSLRIPMNPFLKDLLCGLEHGNDYIFYNPKTKSWIRNIKTAWRTARKEAKLPKSFRFHDLRHCAGTYMIQGGVDIITVKEILGHASVRTTERYLHTTTENKKRAANVLGAIFDPRLNRVDTSWTPEGDEEAETALESNH